MLPVLSLGPLSIPVPGLLMLLSVWVGLTLSERWAPAFGLPASEIYNLLILGLVAGLAGARISFLAAVPGIFLSDPLSLFSLDLNMFDPVGGFLIGVLAAWVFSTRRELPQLRVLDGATPFLAVIALGLAGANLASGASYGMTTDLPWGISLWGAVRHPTQGYEIAARAAALFLIWPRKPVPAHSSGLTFFTFSALISGSQLFIEGFMADSDLVLGGLRSAQLVSWIILAGSLTMIYKFYLSPRRRDESAG